MNPENRMLKQVILKNAAEADYIFSMLMGEDVGPRRDFIEKNATYANIDAVINLITNLTSYNEEAPDGLG